MLREAATQLDRRLFLYFPRRWWMAYTSPAEQGKKTILRKDKPRQMGGKTFTQNRARQTRTSVLTLYGNAGVADRRTDERLPPPSPPRVANSRGRFAAEFARETSPPLPHKIVGCSLSSVWELFLASSYQSKSSDLSHHPLLPRPFPSIPTEIYIHLW